MQLASAIDRSPSGNSAENENLVAMPDRPVLLAQSPLERVPASNNSGKSCFPTCGDDAGPFDKTNGCFAVASALQMSLEIPCICANTVTERTCLQTSLIFSTFVLSTDPMRRTQSRYNVTPQHCSTSTSQGRPLGWRNPQRCTQSSTGGSHSAARYCSCMALS